MMKYKVEYKNCKATYTREKLESVCREVGMFDLFDDSDFLACAVKHFCYTHFMCACNAHLDSEDAGTRGKKWQDWKYEPDGCFAGWIHAFAID